MTNTPGPGRAQSRSIGAGAAGMILVGGCVGVSRDPDRGAAVHRAGHPLRGGRGHPAGRWPAAWACRSAAPRGREWLWLVSLAATGLVLFNVAIVRGDAHAQPAMIAVAVACVPVLLGLIGPLLTRSAARRGGGWCWPRSW